MRMKNKKKGRIKRMYTSIRYRMISISISVVVFIAVMLAAILIELSNNQEQYMVMYREGQQQVLSQLADTLRYMAEGGTDDTGLVTYLSENVAASGSRFFVLVKGSDVLFAKNDITTRCLGSLNTKDALYDSLQTQSVSVLSATFEQEGQTYEIAEFYDVDTVKAEADLNKHQYYILLAVAIMGLVLVSLLVTMLGSWNRTEKQLKGAEKELDIRNEKMEQISQETGTLTGDKTDLLTKEEVTGIIKSKRAEFYNIYTIKMLLQKSEDKELKPLQMILVNVVMGNQYYTKDQIFNAMERIKHHLRPVEVMGEIRRGRFVILAYRTPVETARKRIREIEAICKEIEENEGFSITCQLLAEDERKAIERFEECQMEEMI
ncbi:MAG TPA: hypothetical protein DHV96_14315 [Lachnospiraceae bacterium]|nr:hypothetical protein [Lachnospiraceae bacterium]